MSRFFKVKNFEKFQHYRNRTPPWIKLYNELLDDYEFGCLPDASKMHLIAIWLLASRAENRLPRDPEWIAKRINATDPVDLDAIEAAGFIVSIQDDTPVAQDASTLQAKRLTRERDTNEEREKDKKEENGKDRSGDSSVVVSPHDSVLARETDTLHEYTDKEINALQLEFDTLDVSSELEELVCWADRKGIIKPNERKSAIFGALKRKHDLRAQAGSLVAARENPPSIQPSQALLNSKLARLPHRRAA